MSDSTFTGVFSEALRGFPCTVRGLSDTAVPLPVAAWTREADAADLALLDLCEGDTLDVGCGPGRMAAALAARRHAVLGIDVVPEAVEQARRRGVPALHRDVFARLPGEGRWHTALLADGNIGIGGDPVALLARLRQLIGPEGRIVVELDPPGGSVSAHWVSLECGDRTSRPFRWARVPADAIERVSREVGLTAAEPQPLPIPIVGPTQGADRDPSVARWCAVLGLRP